MYGMFANFHGDKSFVNFVEFLNHDIKYGIKVNIFVAPGF